MVRTILLLVVGLALVTPRAAGAQVCTSCWGPACKQRAASLPRCSKATLRCPTGMLVTEDTSGRCCWPGQSWHEGRCIGVPTGCPSGWLVDPAAEVCALPACPTGQARARDGLHCCWPGQAWNKGRQACVGKPRCPTGLTAVGDQCSGGCGPDEVAVPGGAFTMGSDSGGEDERPTRSVTVSSFCMDRTEVTTAAYQACVHAGGCRAPMSSSMASACNYGDPARSTHPVNCLLHGDAGTFCRWRGARLPTEAEWEYAARGRDGRAFPWGDQPPAAAVTASAPVGTTAYDVSPFGVRDLGGSVREAVSDAYAPYAPGAATDPTGPATATGTRLFRGGAWLDATLAPATRRYRTTAAASASAFGARCVRSAGASPPPRVVTAATCPAKTILVPAGTVGIGSVAGVGDPDEQPWHQATVSAFCVDRTEVTVADYLECPTCPPAQGTVLSDGYTPEQTVKFSALCNAARADRADHPMNCVDWNAAQTFCRWRGGRLPTEAEWVRAARGTDQRPYPWGFDEPDSTRLNACGPECVAFLAGRGTATTPMYAGSDAYETTAPVGSFPRGASPWGALDMAGNVWEWTGDWYGPYPAGTVSDPTGPATGQSRVNRGGSWINGAAPGPVRIDNRDPLPPTSRFASLGFRCVVPPGP